MSDSSQASLSEVTDGRSVRRRDNAERLFDAAMQLAQQHGYQSITADEICQKAGVGRATFFRIYKTKSGLLREFNRRLAAVIEQRVEQSQGDAIAKLLTVADEIAQAWQRGGAVLAAMVSDFIGSPSPGSFHWVHQEIFDLVVGIVVQGRAAGQLRTSLQSEQLASLILHQINIAIAEAGMSGEKNLQPLARSVLEHLLNGVAKKH